MSVRVIARATTLLLFLLLGVGVSSENKGGVGDGVIENVVGKNILTTITTLKVAICRLKAGPVTRGPRRRGSMRMRRAKVRRRLSSKRGTRSTTTTKSN